MNYDVGVFTRRRIISPAESYFAVPPATGSGLLTGLLGYWEFEEAGASSDRLDATANHRDLTVSLSTVSSVTGIVAQATYSSAGAAYQRADDAGMDFTGQWGFSGWFKFDTAPPSSSVANLVAKKFPQELTIIVNRFSNVIGTANGTDSADFSYVPVNATWFFVAGGQRGGNMFCNVGVPSGAGLGTTVTTAVTVPPSHGVGTLSFVTDGIAGAAIDQVGLWSGRGLSDADIALLYNGGSGKAYAAL